MCIRDSYTRGIDIADNLSPGITQKVFSGEVKFTNEEMSKLCLLYTSRCV